MAFVITLAQIELEMSELIYLLGFSGKRCLSIFG